MSLAPLLHRRLAFVAPPVRDRGELFRLFAAAASPRLGGRSAAELAALLEAREASQSTLLLAGVAFPHAIAPGLEPTLVGVARLDPPVIFERERPGATLCFALFGNSETPWVHIRTLARIARIVNDPAARSRLESAGDSAALLRQLRIEDAAETTSGS